MPDVFTKEKRSAVMSLIRGRGNKDTELALMKLLREHGIKGWRRQVALPGRPDFTFRRERLVIFVDGCFWHSCPQHATRPVNNAAFWLEKLARNGRRDRQVDRELRAAGWRVLRIWEHELRRKTEQRAVRRIERALERGGS